MGKAGGGSGRFYKFFKKKIRSPGDIDLNISWHSIFFGKYFMAPPIHFSSFIKVFLWQYFKVLLKVILKFQITREVNIHNNIQKTILKKILRKTSNIFCHIKILLQQ